MISRAVQASTLALLLWASLPALATVDAGAGCGGMNPQGIWYPGQTPSVMENASGMASVELFGGYTGAAQTQRCANFSDPLLGLYGGEGSGSGSATESAHATLGLNGMIAVGSSKQLTFQDIGTHNGHRWGEAASTADDGTQGESPSAQDDTYYTYTVQGMGMPGPQAPVPDVLAPEEISG